MGQHQGERGGQGAERQVHVFEPRVSGGAHSKGRHSRRVPQKTVAPETGADTEATMCRQEAKGVSVTSFQPSESSMQRLPQRVESNMISGPKFFGPQHENDDAASDLDGAADPAETGDAKKSHECSPQKCCKETAEKVSLTVASWNLAGVSKKAIETVFGHVAECDAAAVQEFPKQTVGWKTISGERYQGIIFQNYLMYRSVGVMYRTDRFQLRKKSSAQRGVWVLLKHVGTGELLWIGSLHLPNNEPKEEIARQLGEFAKAGPKLGERAVILGDFNVQFKWRSGGTGIEPDILAPKWAALRQCFAEAGFQQAPPQEAQFSAPTFHSRKGTVSSTQIDGVFVAGAEQRWREADMSWARTMTGWNSP